MANYNSHEVSSFSIDNATGLLTPRGSVPTGLHPYAVVTHPNGNFVYTIDSTGSSSSGPSISAFSVNPSSGELTSLGQPVSVPLLGPIDLVISPNGAFIFALSSGRVARMSINAATGALTRGPTTTINFASSSSCIAIHPNGTYLYVAAVSSPNGFIQVFSVGGTGALTAINQVPTARGKNCPTIDADGEFMYVTNSVDNVVNSFSINENTGALTLLESDPTGTSPEAVALTP